jgi:predicted HTH transcriptional regulator
MMNIDALIRRIRLGEDSTLELKQVMVSASGRIEPHADGISDELAALGNADGGLLILGVDDGSRAVTGIPIEHIDRVEAWLTAICNDRIKPPLDVITHHLELPVGEDELRPVIVAEVPRSLWVHESANGYFRRVGHAKRKLLPDMLARLFQQRSQARIIRFDEQQVAGAGFEDFDALLVNRFTQLEQDDARIQLQRLHLLRETDDGFSATVAGVLLCTLSPERWLRNAEIIAVAHAGLDNNPDDQIDAQEVRGPLDRQISDAMHFVQRNMRVPARKVLGRVDYPQYDQAAVFEAIVNAVAHRDYSCATQRIRLFLFADRLEIYAPGALPNSMTIASMARISAPRNEVITSLFARYYPVEDPLFAKSQLMDKRGAGVSLILDRSAALSGRRPVYENLSDMELKLTVFAAVPPKRNHT